MASAWPRGLGPPGAGAEQLDDADLARAGDDGEALAGGDGARIAHREVPAAPAALHHQLGGVRETHRGVELEAGKARPADGERAVRKVQHVADEDVALDDAG